MNEKTVDVKFHVIKDNSLHFEKDGVLGGKLLDAAGTRIYYDLKIAKFMAFNATFNLIYLDPIESQTYKIMAIKCLNVSEIQEDLFSANKPPEGLIEADSLIEVKRVNVSESTPKIWKKKQNPVNPRCEILWANVRLNHLSQYEASFGFNLLWNCKDLSFLSEDSNQLQHSLVKTRFKSQGKNALINYTHIPNQEDLVTNPYEPIPIDTAKRIVLLTSPDLLPTNKCFLDIQPSIKNKGETEIHILKQKVICTIFYTDKKSDFFNPSEFRSILENLRDLLDEFHGTDKGFIDQFNPISKIQLGILEKQTAEILEPIKCSWVTMRKVPTNKLDFIFCQYEHIFIDHSRYENLYENLTEKYFYSIRLKSDQQEVLKTRNDCQTYEKNNQNHRLPMKISDSASEPFEKITIDKKIMKKEKTERDNQYISTIQDNLTRFPAVQHTAIDIFKRLLNFICHYDISKVTLILMIFLFSIIQATDIITPIHSNSGMIFQHYGTVLNKVDTWNIVTAFNTNLIWHKIDTLKKLQQKIEQQCSEISLHSIHNETEKYLKILLPNIQKDAANYKILMKQDIIQLEESLQTAEDSTGSYQKNYRTKRAIFRFGSKILKFLYGTPDVNDAEDYNSKFEELYQNQH